MGYLRCCCFIALELLWDCIGIAVGLRDGDGIAVVLLGDPCGTGIAVPALWDCCDIVVGLP